MIEPFSILGILIIAILVFFLSRVLSVVVKIIFYALLAAMVLVFFFGVSLNEVIDWITGIVLWAL